MQYTGQTAEVLLAQGEMKLLKRDLSGLEFFEHSAQIDPANPDLFWRQALALYEYGSEEGIEKILLLASKKLKAAAALAPHSFKIWQLWGSVLSELGKSSGSSHYFLEAKEKFTSAVALSGGQGKDVLADLYWELGFVWKMMAEHSGEAMDLQISVDSFAKAVSYCDQMPPEFWYDYGQSCLDLAQIINDTRFYIKAISCFKTSISNSVSSYESWVSMATALQLLYAQTHDEDHFSQANECFSSAAQLNPQDDTTLWFNWAKFLCEAGRRLQDVKKLRSCIEKCHRAYAADPSDALVMGIWAEALALIGELTDRHDLIYEAQNKVSEACQLAENEPDIWYSYGMCMLSFARYFNEVDYYFQAIEKFQEGISLDRTCHEHWHAIANAYAAVGEMDEDQEMLQRSLRFFEKAIDLHPSSFYIYDYALALSSLGEIAHDQKWLEESIFQFERALNLQKNAIYLHPEWLFDYAVTLDILGDYHEDKSYYARAIEILSHVLMIDPDFPDIHHRIALAYAHLGDLLEDSDHLYRSVHHFRLALKHEEENDHILLDWGVTLINLAQAIRDPGEADQIHREAEYKLTQSAKLGNLNAFYHIACLYSILGNNEKALCFMEKACHFDSLPPIDEMMDDEWLEGLRSTSDFQAFLLQLEKRPDIYRK